MAEKEEKKYDYEKDVKQFLDDSKIAKNIMTKLELDHMKFYASTAEDTLKVKKDNVEDIRQKDLGMLKKTEHQLNFADSYVDKCVDGFVEFMTKSKDESKKEYLKKELNLSDKFNEILATKHLYGTTRDHFKRILADEKDQFTPERFMKKHKNDFMEKFSRDVGAAAGQHLTEKHLDTLIKYAVREDIAKDIKDYMTIDAGKIIVSMYDGRKLTKADLIKTGLLPPHIQKKWEKDLEKKKKQDIEGLAHAA